MTRKRRTPSQPVPQPDRASNPVIPFLHSTAMMADERWDDAITALRRFLELADGPGERQAAYQNLSSCYLALERHDEALAALDEVQQIQPIAPDTVYSRGVTCACASRFPEAIAAFELFTHNWPKLARHREIKQTIRKLRRMESGEIPAGSYLFDHLQAQMIQNLEVGDFHLVEGKARRMIALMPERSEGHFALGIAYVEKGRYSEGLAAYREAHLRDPNYAATLYNIGRTYLQLDQPEPALSWLERALSWEPRNLETLHQLGVACERLGRREEAIQWWNRALKIDRDYTPARWRLHEIGEGPEPAPPVSPNQPKLRLMTPAVKARMRKPQIYRNGGITLTLDAQVGFVLEDADNPLNATVHAGGPFKIASISSDEDLLDMMGMVKMLLRLIDAYNTRDIAVLAYYTESPTFAYHARFQQGRRVEFDFEGRFIINEVPRFFKLRVDCDLSTPYGSPMQGKLIFLNQHPKPGILLNTLGLENS